MKDTKKKHQVPLTPEGKVILTDEEYRAIEYLLIRDKIDMGVLKPFLSDPYIEDISCDGVGPIFIEHKIFKGLKSVIEFKVSSELDEFVVKVAERIKRPITYRILLWMPPCPMVPVSISFTGLPSAGTEVTSVSVK